MRTPVSLLLKLSPLLMFVVAPAFAPAQSIVRTQPSATSSRRMRPSHLHVNGVRLGVSVDTVLSILHTGTAWGNAPLCSYGADNGPAECDAFPFRSSPDTVRMSVDRGSGIVESFTFLWHGSAMRLDSIDSNLHALWGKGTGKDGTQCSEWRVDGEYAWLCRFDPAAVKPGQSDGSLRATLGSDPLPTIAPPNRVRQRSRVSSGSYSSFFWWPNWKPYFTDEIRAGVNVNTLLRQLKVSTVPSCVRERLRSVNQPYATCTWRTPSLTFGGQKPVRLVADIDSVTQRATDIRLEYGFLPRSAAISLMQSIVESVSPLWGSAVDSSTMGVSWERTPFRAGVSVLCASLCAEHEPFQVWLTLGVMSSGMEKDEADILTRY